MNKQSSDLIKIVDDLRNYHHSFLSPKGAAHFLKPFGLKPHTRIAKANPMDFKGLTLNDGMAEAEGMDGLTVAFRIADKYKLDVPDFFGRGSQHEACCNAIIKHLQTN